MPRLLPSLIATLVFNALIAGFLAGLGFGGGFAVNLVFSQCIGLSIMVLCLGVLRLSLSGLARGAAIAFAIAAGALGGHTLARLLTGLGSSGDGSHELQSMLVGLVFGGIAAGFFWLRKAEPRRPVAPVAGADRAAFPVQLAGQCVRPDRCESETCRHLARRLDSLPALQPAAHPGRGRVIG
jgi:hypothetical protein